MKIKYVVVKIDTSQRAAVDQERFPFESVDDAIKKHKEVKYSASDWSYWDLVVEYEE